MVWALLSAELQWMQDCAAPGKHVVTQFGPRRLRDELETVYRAGLAVGQPGEDGFRLIVSPEAQRVVLTRACGPKVRPAAK